MSTPCRRGAFHHSRRQLSVPSRTAKCTICILQTTHLIVSVSASSHMTFNKAFIKRFRSLKAGYKWDAGELFLYSRDITRKLSFLFFVVRTFQSEITLYAAKKLKQRSRTMDELRDSVAVCLQFLKFHQEKQNWNAVVWNPSKHILLPHILIGWTSPLTVLTMLCIDHILTVQPVTLTGEWSVYINSTKWEGWKRDGKSIHRN